MDLSKLKSISQQSYDISLQKSNALRKAESDLVTVYRNHIFRADALTICTVRTLMESNTRFFVLDANSNPVEIVDPREFLETLTQRNQSALNTYHQAYQKFKSKES
jgi:hypothetical protein